MRRQRKTLSMTTGDLRKLNDRLDESSIDMYLRSELCVCFAFCVVVMSV